MLSLLIIIRHKDNIIRLWNNQETKVWHKSRKAKAQDPDQE
jgi:glycerol-3-phosphate acyltransferase PlsY